MTQPARTALIAELMAGEDPDADTYRDALARVTGMVDAVVAEQAAPPVPSVYQPTDWEQLAELGPLATVIRDTLLAAPVIIGDDPADLIAAMTLAVAAYMGRVVPAEHELAELARLRAELGVAEQTIDRMKRTNRMVNGGAREARERAERAEAELATAKQQIAAVLAIPHRTDEELEQMDPEDYQQAVGHDSAVWKVRSMLAAPAVAE